MPPDPLSPAAGTAPSAETARRTDQPRPRGGVRALSAVPLWAWPGALALLSGLWQIGRPQLWRDEIATWSGVGRTLPELLHLLGDVDASTGLYYLLLHGWTSVSGLSAVAMRLPSALFMAVAAAAVTSVGRRLFGGAAGLAGGAVFALLPTVSRYGQEARAYAMVVMAAAVALLLLLRALERSSPGRWALYGWATAFMGAAHLVALAAVVGHAAAVLLYVRRARSWRPAAAFGGTLTAVVAALSPLLVFSHAQVGKQLYWVHRPDLAHPWAAFGGLGQALVGSTAGAVLVGVFVVAGLCAARGHGPARGTAAAGAVLPVLAVTAVSETGTSYFLARYLLFTLPCWAVLAGAGLVTAARGTARVLPARRRRAALAVLTACGLAATVAATLPDQLALRSYRAHEWISYPVRPLDTYFSYQGAADTVAARARPGDGLVYIAYWGDMIDLGVDHYLGPREKSLDEFFVSRTPRRNGTYRPTYCAVPASCAATAPDRVWLVRQSDGFPHPTGSLAAQLAALRRDYRVERTFHLSRIDVMLLVRTTRS